MFLVSEAASIACHGAVFPTYLLANRVQTAETDARQTEVNWM